MSQCSHCVAVLVVFCAQVDAADASRIASLSTDIGREEAGVAQLRQQCQGLEKEAAALQDKIDKAGE